MTIEIPIQTPATTNYDISPTKTEFRIHTAKTSVDIHLSLMPVASMLTHDIAGSMIILSGDVETNPGPVKYPCGICKRAVKYNQSSVACDQCDQWIHRECMHMNTAVFEGLKNISWYCDNCGIPNFTDSFFAGCAAKVDNTYSCLSQTNSSSLLSLDSGTEIHGPIAMSSPISKKSLQAKTSKPLRLLNINTQSINNEKTEMLNVIDEYHPDIIVATETWLKPSVCSSEVIPPCYVTYRQDRKDGYGGVLIAVKNDLLSEEITSPTKPEHLEAVFVKISLVTKKTLIIGGIYRPTNNDNQYATELTDFMIKLSKKHSNAIQWFCGDFNLPDVNWQSNTIEGCRYPSSINQLFIDCAFNCKMEQVVEKPTRMDNILDLFFTNRPSLVSQVQIKPGISDHEMVCIDSAIRPAKVKPVQRKIFLWKKGDIDQLKASVMLFADEFCEKFNIDSPVESMWASLKDNLLQIQEKCIPSKLTSTKFHQPWINRRIKRISRRKRKWYNIQKRTKCYKAKQIYEELKKESRRACQTAHNDYLNNMFAEDQNGNKKFWSYIKSKRKEAVGISMLRNENGVAVTSNKEMANILNRQFTSVFGLRNAEPLPTIAWQYPTMKQLDFSAAGIKKLLDDLDVTKACGPDDLSARLIKTLSSELSSPLELLYSATHHQGLIPSDWKHARVSPIFKKGDRNQAENYRPVSLTCILCKIAEHIIVSQMYDHLDYYGIFTDAQHGFRKKRSTETQLLLTTDDFMLGLEKNIQTDAILLDFSKAFDKVPHHLLIHKLARYGINSNAISWISSFLNNRTQEVHVQGSQSQISEVTSGVPQGSVLGPLLFLMFINDMPSYLKNSSTIRLFADDAIIYRQIKTPQDGQLLQEDLECLLHWEKDWGMAFHPQKCQTLRVTRKKTPTIVNYNIRGHLLECVPSSKYLGLIISNDLSWKKHIQSISTTANRTLSLLQRNIYHCPQPIKTMSYKSLVRPQLEYCSTIWDPHNKCYINQLESIQNRAARFILNDYRRYSSVTHMKSLIGLESLESRRKLNKAILFYKMQNNLVDLNLQLRPSFHFPGRFMQIQCRTTAYQRSCIPDAIVVWNSLAQSTTTAASLEEFKTTASSELIKTF